MKETAGYIFQSHLSALQQKGLPVEEAMPRELDCSQSLSSSFPELASQTFCNCFDNLGILNVQELEETKNQMVCYHMVLSSYLYCVAIIGRADKCHIYYLRVGYILIVIR